LQSIFKMEKNQYIIQFEGLPIGVHDYEFDVKDSFFKNISDTELEKANIRVKASLTKQNHLMQMNFDISGTVGIPCDRCLKNFDFPVSAIENLVIKHGNQEESTDDILVISEGTSEFDVAQYIYEYIMLAIPARRVPCETDAEVFKCDFELLDKLQTLIVNEEADESAETESESEAKSQNPLWKELNKLNKLN
jgi:uncharacterized protein